VTATVPHALRPGLPAMPARMAGLPIDHRGFPVPWFVAWIEGEPDHRIVHPKKLHAALGLGRCWICGGALGAFKTFTIGPMCCVTRANSEPPSHIECARYAAQACPFLSRPHAKRREAGLPEAELRPPPGLPIDRNPGVVCLWTAKQYTTSPVRSVGANPGVLFRLGNPESVEFWAEGRRATRAEVEASVASGLPILAREAVLDDEHNEKLAGLRIRRPNAAQVAYMASVTRLRLLLDDHFGESNDERP
jgi:hypothetical protein